MLTVEYSAKDHKLLNKESKKNAYSTIRKRCQVLYAKMSNPKLSCENLATICGCCRNFVMKTIHTYNNEGIDSVLKIAPKTGRPGKLKDYMDAIDAAIDKRLPRTIKEARHIIEEVSGVKVSLSRARQLLYQFKNKSRKTRPLPGKVNPEKQKEWIENFQPVRNEAEKGDRRLLFMDAVHFTLEAFTCRVWSKKPVSLPSGAGRHRFNVLGAIDPFNFDLIESHSMTYVDADQTILFLEKIRAASGEIPVTIVLDNARYQHCKAVMDKAKELNIQLMFLPPYSPNLNIIERLWKFTRKEVLAGKYFPTPAQFHEALRYFFEDDFHNHKSSLKSLLTLNFQSFENAHLLCA